MQSMDAKKKRQIIQKEVTIADFRWNSNQPKSKSSETSSFIT